MKLNMGKFKKVSADDKTTTLRHEDGHNIVVMHSALSPKMRSQLAALPTMADGGEVEEEAGKKDKKSASIPGGPGSPYQDPKAAAEIEKGAKESGVQPKRWIKNVKEGLGLKVDTMGVRGARGGEVPADPTQRHLLPGDKEPNKVEKQVVREARSKLADGGEAIPVDLDTSKPLNIPEASEPIDESNLPYGVPASAMSAAGLAQLQKGPKAEEPAGEPPTVSATPMSGAPVQPEAPQTPGAVGATPVQSDAAKTINHIPEAPSPEHAYAQELSGIKGEANVAQHLAQAQYDVQQKGLEKQQEQLSRFQQHVQDHFKEYQDFLQDVKNQHVDPNHYMGSLDTGQRIGTAIGLILGGMGAGANGTNPALDFVNRQIDRDIEAQKANLGKSENLLSANLRQFGNMRDAADMTKAMQLGITADQLKQAGMQAQGQNAQFAAQQAAGKLEQQVIPLFQQMAMRRMMMQAASQSGGKDDTTSQMLPYLRVLNPEAAKEMEGRYIPKVGMASVPISEKAREEITSRQSLQDQIHTLRDWASKHSGSLSPADAAYGKALASSVQDAYRRANGQGVFREAEANFVKGIVAEDPTAFFNKLRVDPKYKALEDSNLASLNGVKKAYGLPEGEAAPEIKTMGGVKYQKVLGGWKKVQ